jgi:hypothetical protein
MMISVIMIASFIGGSNFFHVTVMCEELVEMLLGNTEMRVKIQLYCQYAICVSK